MQVKILLLLPLALTAVGALAAPTPPLVAQTPIQISAEAKRFDLVAVDAAQHRLIAAHSQAGTFAVLDLTSGKVLAEIAVGDKPSGVAIDAADGKYYTGTLTGVSAINIASLKKTGFIATSGPTDDMAYDAEDHTLYVTHDDGTELWVIDARKDTLMGHIDIPGVPEIMGMDAASHRLYLNIKDKNEVAVIDLQKGAVTALWPAPATDSPHGLALDLKAGRLYVAGHSAKVSVFSLPDGKSLPAIDIGDGRVDQIAFDAGTDKLYIPSTDRLVTVDTATGSVLGQVPMPKGTHSVAVDPNTHLVWIVYADDKNSYAQAFAPTH